MKYLKIVLGSSDFVSLIKPIKTSEKDDVGLCYHFIKSSFSFPLTDSRCCASEERSSKNIYDFGNVLTQPLMFQWMHCLLQE